LYFDLAGNDLEVKQHQLSGELQFNGVAGRLAYTAGLFAFGERPKLLPWGSLTDVFYTCGCGYDPGHFPLLTADPRQLRVENESAYAQGTYKLTDRLSTTLGARYSHEKSKLDGKSYLVDANQRLTNIVLDTGTARHSWNSFTYRADVQYQATSDLMAYGSIARGFKSGGFNVRGDPGLPNMGFYSFDPETALNYEIGLRSEWLHRNLRFNATLFDTEYKDIQLRQQTFVDGMFTTLIENAAKARIRGGEIEIAAAPFKRLNLGAALGHLEPKYLDVGRVRGLTLASKFQRTPRNTFSAWFEYEALVRAGTIQLHGDFSYRSKEQFQILAASNDQKGYALVGARLTLRPRNRHWSIALFGTNLADVRYRTAGRGTLINQAGFTYSSIGMPRQFGVQISAY
jgi:iron complex outermembrane receptor protein